jgi:carboxylesterase type B
LGAVHLWDMFYLFGWLKAPADQPRDARLVDQEQLYLTNFARSGNPNGPGLPNWPMSGTSHAYLDFASSGAVSKKNLRGAACDVYAKQIDAQMTALKAH